MPFDILPIWSQWGIVGVLLAGYAWLAVQYVRGNLVPRKQLDQVQKVADTFKDAWTADQQTKADQAALLASMTTAASAFEHAFNSLPVPDKSEGRHEA